MTTGSTFTVMVGPVCGQSNTNARKKKRKRGGGGGGEEKGEGGRIGVNNNNNSINNRINHVGPETTETLLTSTSSKDGDRKNDITVLAVGNQSSINDMPPSPLDGRLFLTPQDPSFPTYVETHYKGFVHIPCRELHPSTFHVQAKTTFERLRDANYYQYDIVMAGGKHSSRTFVKRTLVGEPGITYKYLGLRLFAHSWSSSKEKGGGGGTTPLLRSIGELNQYMIEMTKQLGRRKGGGETNDGIGRCDYNLTLINYMEPTSHHSRVGFKEEANYGMGKVSVSWHADSSLEKNSSIGVYHCLPTQRASTWDWRIALRPSPTDTMVAAVATTDSSTGTTLRTASTTTTTTTTTTPPLPVVVNTKDGDAYFLLGTFNERYQHCVLAGSEANRISSTHRVAVTQEDTYDYILKRCKIARKRFRLQLEGGVSDSTNKGNGSSAAITTITPVDAKVIRYCQQVLTEVEMEWIAQYWLQGAQHDTMHIWWQRPMKTLEAYWVALEEASYQLYELCVMGNQNPENNNNNNKLVPIDVIKVLKNEFIHRQSLRLQWDERRADKIYQRRINPEYRPVARPQFGEDLTVTKSKDDGRHGRLPKDLSTAIDTLTRILEDRTLETKKGYKMKRSNDLTTKISLMGGTTSPKLDGPKREESANPANPTARKGSINGDTPTLKKSKKNKKKRKPVK